MSVMVCPEFVSYQRRFSSSVADDEVAGEVLRLDFSAFFPPQPQQGGLVIAHDNPGVRTADEAAPMC
jgi:hypothetical protein